MILVCRPGARGLVVRWHVRHRAAGPHPLLWEAEQSGQRLHCPEATRHRELTALSSSSQLRTKSKIPNTHGKVALTGSHLKNLPHGCQNLHDPKILFGSLQWLQCAITATYWPQGKLPELCLFSSAACQEPADVSGWFNVWGHLTGAREAPAADVYGHRPGTGRGLILQFE